MPHPHATDSRRTSSKKAAAQICLIYGAFGVLWILGTDLLVRQWPGQSVRLQVLKGIGFILINAGLLYHFTRKFLQRQLETDAVLTHTNRALDVYSEVNQAIIHAADESQLLKSACQIIAETGGYPLAWIGRA